MTGPGAATGDASGNGNAGTTARRAIGLGKEGDMSHWRPLHEAVAARAHRARRTGVRLWYTAIGFAAAYYLDPERGPARRRRVAEAWRRARPSVATARSVHDEPRDGVRAHRAAAPVDVVPRLTAEGMRISAGSR